MRIEREYPFHKYFICFLAFITVLFIALRILINLYDFPLLLEISRDVDFNILLRGFHNGLRDFYKIAEMPPGIPDWPPYYLYFWYFLFLPMGLIPFEIGVYVWDALRLISVSYIILKSYKIFGNRKDLFIFYGLLTIGYLIDGWFNNVNFVILFFLFLSYSFVNDDEKLLAGIFFTLATFKINSILFLPVILAARKIKFRDLLYYLIPFFIICLPYLIFPDFLSQMLNNWLSSDTNVQGLTIVDSILWKALQPSHLMFISFLYIIFFESLTEGKRKKQIRIIIIILFTAYYIYNSLVVWVLPIFLP